MTLQPTSLPPLGRECRKQTAHAVGRRVTNVVPREPLNEVSSSELSRHLFPLSLSLFCT
jgi:hypothetical protein